jgi:hypothetical protein
MFEELMLEVLLGLRRDIPFAPLPLEFGDELSGCAHPEIISPWRKRLCEPATH